MQLRETLRKGDAPAPMHASYCDHLLQHLNLAPLTSKPY